MDDSDRAIMLSYILILGWTGLWNAQPSTVLAYGFFFMVVILTLVWLQVGLNDD